jgi:hypothetical protein
MASKMDHAMKRSVIMFQTPPGKTIPNAVENRDVRHG